MHFRERTVKDEEEIQRLQQESHQSTIWTALPAIITSFNAKSITVEAIPTVQGTVTSPDGSQRSVTMPTCVDVPVFYQRGGGYSMTFPIKPGDECLLIFASRCIDGWWQSGQITPPTEHRMHDLSDAFALVGPYSQRTKIANVSTTTAQFRSDDGTLIVDLDHAGGVATVKAPTQIILDCPIVHMTGKVTSVLDMIAGTVSLQHHVHSGVGGGINNSGPPLP